MSAKTYKLKLYEDSQWKEAGLSRLEILLDDSRNDCSDFSDIGDMLEYGKEYRLTIAIEPMRPKTPPRVNSSFIGFWRRSDRGKAWADLSRAAWRTDEGYRRAAGRIRMTYDHRNKVARVARWASERARKYGWKTTPEQPFFFYH